MSQNVSTEWHGNKRESLLEMFASVWHAREIIIRLAYRDVAVRYRESMLGYVWALLPQLVTVAVFTFLASRRVFDMGPTAIPYVVHVVWSFSLWQLFSTTLVACSNSLIASGGLVTKVNFRKETLVFASIAQPLIDYLIRFIPIVLAMLWVGFVPSVYAFLTIPMILIVLVLAVGIGFLFSVLNLVIKDLGNMLSMVLTFGMFFAPILYPPPVRDPFALVNVVNPFSPLLIATQELLAGNTLSQPSLLSFIVLMSLIVFIVGWRVFSIAIPRVCERA